MLVMNLTGTDKTALLSFTSNRSQAGASDILRTQSLCALTELGRQRTVIQLGQSSSFLPHTALVKRGATPSERHKNGSEPDQLQVSSSADDNINGRSQG